MFGRIAEQILLLKGFMAALAGSAVLLALLCRLSLSAFGWNRPYRYIIGLSMRNQVRTCCLYLRFVMLIWAFGAMAASARIYTVMLLCLGAILALTGGSIRKTGEEIGNTVLLSGGMYAAGLLLAYMREIQFERNILLVYILLGCFIALYDLYFFLRDIKNMSQERKAVYEKAANTPK